MKIYELVEKLERAQENLGEVYFYEWDSENTGINTFKINCVNSEEDQIEQTQ